MAKDIEDGSEERRGEISIKSFVENFIVDFRNVLNHIKFEILANFRKNFLGCAFLALERGGGEFWIFFLFDFVEEFPHMKVRKRFNFDEIIFKVSQ